MGNVSVRNILRVVGLCKESNTGAEEGEHEAGLEDERIGAAGRDGGRLRLGRGSGDNGLDNSGLVGGDCPAALVLVVPGRVGGDGRVRLAPVAAGAVGRRRIALGDSDGPGHGRGRGGGDVLLDLTGHCHRGAGGNDEDPLNLHFESMFWM